MEPKRIAELRKSAGYRDGYDRQGELTEALDEIERLQGIVDKVECLRAVVMEITSEMANIDSLTGLGMRENVWREKLREAAEAGEK